MTTANLIERKNEKTYVVILNFLQYNERITKLKASNNQIEVSKNLHFTIQTANANCKPQKACVVPNFQN